MAVFTTAAILAGVKAAVDIGSAFAEKEARDDEAARVRQAARRALRLKRRDLSIRSIEERTAARQKRRQASRQAALATGQGQVSAAAAGVEGRSEDAVIGQISGDLARFYRSVDRNLMVTLDQIDRLREGAEAEAQARINQAQGGSLTRALLRTGGALLDFGRTMSGTSPIGDTRIPDPLPPEPEPIPEPASPF